jgi:glucan-binding YG repeat protein
LKKQMVKKTGIAQWYKQSINMHELLSEKSNIWILDCDYLHEHLFDAEHVVTEGFKLMKQELLQQRQSTKTFFERNNILMNVCMKLEAQVEAAKNAGTTLRDKDNLLKEKMVDMSVSAFSPILIDEDESSSTLSRPSALDYLESPLPGSLPSSAPVLSAITASATSASATTIPTTTTSSLTTIASSPAPSLSSPSSSSFIVKKENAAATRPSHTSTTLQEKVKPQSQGQPPPQQQQTFPAEGKQRGGNLETSDQWKFYPEPPKGDEKSGTGIRKGRRVPKS